MMYADNQTHLKNILIFGKARFSILFDRLIRMEWAQDSVFQDDPTLTVFNRFTPPCPFKTVVQGKRLTLATGQVTINYLDDNKPFHRGNLSGSFEMKGRKKDWRFGDGESGNLGSTLRTLDTMLGGKKEIIRYDAKGNKIKTGKYAPADMGKGFLSREGWVVLDDAQTILLKDDIVPGRRWVSPPLAGTRRDFYFLAYGLDFASALRDASAVWGRQPLPPRYALGYWYSRYWAYTDKEIEKLVEEFDTYSIPLDVMVVDMDWHRLGWTGYTFSEEFFPDPKEFLSFLKSKKLKITFNLHPAKGVGKHEKAFPSMCRAMGLDPAKTDRVPFDCTDPRFMQAYFRLLHHPLERQGVDFWWMDWQQGTSTAMKGLDPLPWINQLHWEDMENRKDNRRPLCFSRFGGPGAGRTPIGFSGDTISVWDSLAFQPYFTATAANILYGYWSHDIGGHMPGPIDPELYTRWMQFGLYSPVLRTHTTKNRNAERRVFEYPQPFKSIMIASIRRRYELVPYIYTECRHAFDTGLSLVRPLYHQWPDEPSAYEAKDQYLFGRNMVVAPVIKPADKKTGLSKQRLFLPRGKWIDTAKGDFLEGGKWLTRNYLIEEVPLFVRPGTLVPCQKTRLRIEKGGCRDLIIEAFPGNGSYDLYEDDGVSRDYLKGHFAIIPLTQKKSASGIRITINRPKGRFKGFLARRSLEVRLFPALPPNAVAFNGKTLPFVYRLKEKGWHYDGDSGAIIVRLPEISLGRKNNISFRFGAETGRASVSGLKGLMARLARIGEAVNSVSYWDPLHPEERLASFVAQTGNRISRNPLYFGKEMKNLRRALKKLPRVIREYEAVYRHKQKRPDQADVLRQAGRLLKNEITYISMV